MSRKMTYPEDVEARRGAIAPLLNEWVRLTGDPQEAMERVFDETVAPWNSALSDTTQWTRRARVYAQASWEVGGRVCWSLDAETAFALAMTVPPERSLSHAPVRDATGTECVFVEIPPLLWVRPSVVRPVPGTTGPEADVPVIGLYMWDAVDEEGTFVQTLSVAAGRSGGVICFADGLDNNRGVGLLAAADPAEPARAALIALNLLAALRHTRIVERRIETFPTIRNPGKAKIEARRGLTRAPITHIRLEVGPPMGTVQERRVRPEGPPEAPGSTTAPHWVRGHWHRFWTGTPEPTDRPDAERPSKHCTLHRVTRWVRPYFTGDAPPVAPRVSVGLYRGEV